MTVSFNEIAPTTRTPFVFVELDGSRASQAVQAQPYRVLLVGQRRSTGSIAALTPVRLQNKDQAAVYFGQGSQLAQMAAAYFAANQQTETWAAGLADPSGNAAAGSVVFGGSATEAGTVAFYVGGRRYAIAVAAAASNSSLATALAAAINADTYQPLVATPSVATCALVARHVGTIGNDVDLRHSYQDGEGLPAGLTVAVTQMSGGTGDAAISALWANLGDQWFNVIACPFTDATNLTSLEAELKSRASAQRHVDAVAVSAKDGDGSLSTLSTLGNGRNSPFSVIQDSGNVPSLSWEVCASLAGVIAKYGSDDPARPFQTLPLPGILAPAVKDRRTQAERNSLLYSGISTFTVGPDGTVQIERTISTYKTNAAGGSDTAWLDINTALTVSFLRWDFVNAVTSKYSRHKVANDGTRYGSGQMVVTPALMRAELIARFRAWESLGLVEDFEQFKQDLIVERNVQDPSRLDVVLPPNLVNGLRVLAARLSFIL